MTFPASHQKTAIARAERARRAVAADFPELLAERCQSLYATAEAGDLRAFRMLCHDLIGEADALDAPLASRLASASRDVCEALLAGASKASKVRACMLACAQALHLAVDKAIEDGDEDGRVLEARLATLKDTLDGASE